MAAATHAVHHAEIGWVGRYIFSTDHKMIAKQYLLNGLFFAIFGWNHCTDVPCPLGCAGRGNPGSGTIQLVCHHARHVDGLLGGPCPYCWASSAT